METICWKIWVDAGSFLKGVIMAQCYGIILWFKAMAPEVQVEHPSSTDLCRMMRSALLEASEALLEASEVIGRSSRGMGMLNQCWLQKLGPSG